MDNADRIPSRNSHRPSPRPPRPSAAPRSLLRFAALGLAVGLAAIAGCQSKPANSPSPGDGSAPGLSGMVLAPPVMHRANAGSWETFRGPLNEAPLASASVVLRGARGEDLGLKPVTTDSQGQFHFDHVPAEAGLITAMPSAPEASRPLMSVYRRGQTAKVGVPSTLVAGALRKAVATQESLTFAAFDAAKIAELEAEVAARFDDANTVVSLHYLDQLLITWARADQQLKAPLEALSRGITAPATEPSPPPGLKK